MPKFVDTGSASDKKTEILRATESDGIDISVGMELSVRAGNTLTAAVAEPAGLVNVICLVPSVVAPEAATSTVTSVNFAPTITTVRLGSDTVTLVPIRPVPVNLTPQLLPT